HTKFLTGSRHDADFISLALLVQGFGCARVIKVNILIGKASNIGAVTALKMDEAVVVKPVPVNI
ncbi:MAG: hypothetical protein JSS14_30320, partial [Proteobacteria bacterium]|nr:hypothetical protein [Pseudomonadota bacterium]